MSDIKDKLLDEESLNLYLHRQRLNHNVGDFEVDYANYLLSNEKIRCCLHKNIYLVSPEKINPLLVNTFRNYNLKGIVVKQPQGQTTYKGIPVISVSTWTDRLDSGVMSIWCDDTDYENRDMLIEQVMDDLPLLHYWNDLQYFDVFKSKAKEVFIDGGSSDGQTTKRFFKWSTGWGKSIMIDIQDVEIFLENFVGFDSKRHSIEAYQAALFDCSNKICSVVDATDPDSRRVLNASTGFWGNESILSEVNSLAIDDYFLDSGVTFIKLDIEGSELFALKGARKLITEQKPRLAISVYHKQTDLDIIPELLLEMVPEYKFKLRSYHVGLLELILYAEI